MGAGITKIQESNARRNAVGKLADKLRKAGAQIEFVNGTRQTWRSAIARFNGMVTVTIYSVCQRASNAECFIYACEAEEHGVWGATPRDERLYYRSMGRLPPPRVLRRARKAP